MSYQELHHIQDQRHDATKSWSPKPDHASAITNRP